MSLTRDEWCKMWESIKTIESILVLALPLYRRQHLQQEIDAIKKQIQSVIGQME